MSLHPNRRATDQALRDQPLFWFGIVLLGLLVGVMVSVIVSTVSNSRSNEALKESAAVAKTQASLAQDQADLAKKTATLAKQQLAEAVARENELKSVICIVYVPIAKAHPMGANSGLGATIVHATGVGARLLNCPGIN